MVDLTLIPLSKRQDQMLDKIRSNSWVVMPFRPCCDVDLRRWTTCSEGFLFNTSTCGRLTVNSFIQKTRSNVGQDQIKLMGGNAFPSML